MKRDLCAELDGLRCELLAHIKRLEDIGSERDRLYTKLLDANKESADRAAIAATRAVDAALVAVEKAAAETKSGLNEYKVANNEWRGTVNDLISRFGGGMDTGQWIVKTAIAIVSALAGAGIAIVVR